MSALLFMRFLARPFQIAYIFPSSKAVVRRVSSKIDYSKARTIVEFGPGEGCHTREIVSRMRPDARLLLFELDPKLTVHLQEQFADEPRVEVLNTDAACLRVELDKRGIDYCDYVVSGIPFSVIELNKKRRILRTVFDSLAPNPVSAFVIYQVTNELKQYATMFARSESQYFTPNIPPMIVTTYYKQAQSSNGSGKNKDQSLAKKNGRGREKKPELAGRQKS